MKMNFFDLKSVLEIGQSAKTQEKIMNFLKTICLATVLVVTGCGIMANGTEKDVRDNASVEAGESGDDLRSEVRNLSGFNGIDVGGTIVADITVGQDFKVVVEAKESILPKIFTKVENNTLKVNFEKNWWKSLKSKSRDTKARVTISLPMLDDLNISGASKATVTGVNSEKLTIDVSGASNVSIEGFAREVVVDLSGASSLKADGLLSEVAEMDLSGASSAKVNVTSQLNVDVSGASSVRYKGDPVVKKDTSGASSVRKQ